MVSNRHLLFQGSIFRGELIYFQVYDMVFAVLEYPETNSKSTWINGHHPFPGKIIFWTNFHWVSTFRFFRQCLSQLVFKKLHTYIYTLQCPPRGGVWTLRGRLVAPLTIHLAPLGGSRYIHHSVFSWLFTLSLQFYHFSKVFVPKLYSQISLGNPPFFPHPEASTLAQRWIDLRSGFGSSSNRATGTEHLAPLGRVIFFAGKSGDGTDETKKSEAWIFWEDFLGCFLFFFVWFLCWKVFFVGGFLLGWILRKLDDGFKSFFLSSHLFGLLFFPMGWKYIKSLGGNCSIIFLLLTGFPGWY